MKDRKEGVKSAEGVSPGPEAPDGGWGWMIVFAVFVGNCLIDGCIGAFGIFYPVLSSAFESGPALTSMAGSLLVATYQLSGPFAGILSQKFGCRWVCFVGGCIGTIGFILASIAKNIVVFMLTFGVFVGMGTGMYFLPGHVIVNHYFDKKRGIAGGIVCAGAGFGLLIMAPVSQLLISNFGWRGAMLIIGGIFMQLCVCAVLLRPLRTKPSFPAAQNSPESESLLPNGVPNSDGVPRSTNTGNVLTSESHLSITSSFMSKEESLNNGAVISNGGHCDITCSVRDVEKAANDVSQRKGQVAKLKLDRIKSSSDNALALKHKQNSKNVAGKSVARSLQHIPQESPSALQIIPTNFQFLHPLALHISKQQVFSSYNSLTITGIETTSTDEKASSSSSWCSRVSMDFSIFRNRNYVPLLLGAVFIQMGQFIPNTYLPEYCYTIGLDENQVSIIMAIYGALNILGRLTAGCLANLRLDALWLCNFGMLMCGIGCVLFPFYTSFAALCAFAIVVGYFIGYFPPLQILIMIEHLGLEKLSSGLGIMMLAKGPAAFFGPPVAGLVYTQTKNYALSIVFAAILFLLSAVIQSLVPLFNKCSKHRKGTSMNFDLDVEVENR